MAPEKNVLPTATEFNKNTNDNVPSLFSRICPPRINPALVPLKIALFLWFGGISGAGPFCMLFFKQRGLTIKQVSIVNMVIPFFQTIGPLLSGIIADKIGRPKPVLFGNLILVFLAITGFMFVPNVNVPAKTENIVSICFSNSTDLSKETSEQLTLIGAMINSCSLHCHSCINGTSCENTTEFEYIDIQFNHILNVSQNDSCTYLLNDTTQICCDARQPLSCRVLCNGSLQPGTKNVIAENNTKMFFISLILLIIYQTSVSNTFMFMDVTTMSMVRAHNSDFGRERFWSISGTIVLSPLFGYLVQVTTPVGAVKQCSTAFYALMGTTFLTILAIWKLEVNVEPPGKNMLRKATTLFKSPDVLMFMFCLFALGTVWAYGVIFSPLFLDELDASSMVLALLPVVGNVLGLPFLLTSNWWVEHVGNNNIFLLALLTNVVTCTAYSFLINPWIALICEMGSVFTYHLLWVAVIRHSRDIAPEGLVSTVISTSSAIHYSFSKATASLSGGLIMSEFGARCAYRVIAIVALVTAALYATYLFVRRKFSCTDQTTNAGNG